MSMSKDQVEFSLAVNGREAEKLRRPFFAAFQQSMPLKGTLRPDRVAEYVLIRCRPSQFARFLILRNEAGCSNGFKELGARLISSPEVPAILDVSRNSAS
jgi:hypothetical protein